MAFSLTIGKKGKCDMRKFLLLSGVFFGLICGSARAEYYRQPGTRVVSRTVMANYVRPLPRKETEHPRYTLGLDVGRNHLDLEKEGNFKYKSIAETEYNFFKPTLGFRFNKKVGMELFYQQAGKENKGTRFNGNNIDVGVKYAAYGVDFLFYQPIDKQLDILMSLGGAYYDFDINLAANVLGYSVNGNVKEESFGMRTGLGLQFNLNRNWAVRAMAYYVTMTGSNDYVKNIMEMSLGLRYSF